MMPLAKSYRPTDAVQIRFHSASASSSVRGARPSRGKSNEVVAETLADPGLFGVLSEGMCDADPVLRMRCADAVDKITARHPQYFVDRYRTQ